VLFFSHCPQLDLLVSSLYYSEGAGFFLQSKWWAWVGYRTPPAVCVVLTLLCGVKAIRVFWHTKSLKLYDYRKIIYVLLVCAVGPGIVVHHIFKDNFNRARPRQVQYFGGDVEFRAPLLNAVRTNQHFSFPSGHAAVGYMFCAFGFMMHGLRRYLVWMLSVMLGLLFGWVRIVQGAHFLSDVIFSGSVVFATAALLHLIMTKYLQWDLEILRHRI
jgi:lipid A 4'-phosphatase